MKTADPRWQAWWATRLEAAGADASVRALLWAPASPSLDDPRRLALDAAARDADVVFPTSSFAAAELLGRDVPVVALPAGAGPALLSGEVLPDEATLSWMGARDVLLISRGRAFERVAIAVQVAALLGRLNPEARLVVAHLDGSTGRSPSPHVEHVDARRPEVLAALYARASALLSVADYEAEPSPVLEALRRDVPVVAFDAGAIAELLSGAGVLVHHRERGPLAGVLHEVSLPGALREQILEGQRARAEALSAERLDRRVEALLRNHLRPRPFREARTAAPGRLTFVVQRYGSEVNGGAEFFTRMLAERLAKSRQVEVRTTCAVDARTWENRYSPGEERLNGVRILRFPVDRPREIQAFDRVSAGAYSGAASDEDERRWIEEQGPTSTALLSSLRAAEPAGLYIYVSYLYPPTVFGLPLHAERSVLISTFHDEPALKLRVFDELVARARVLLCLTPEEAELARRRFRVLPPEVHVASVGITAPKRSASGAFRARRSVGRYLLYAGRVDAGKGCGELLAAYQKYRAASSAPLELVLLGAVGMKIPEVPGVHAFGFVSEEERDEAIWGAEAVVVPSPYESLSLILLEAMAAARPVIANAVSPILEGHLLRSGAGVAYRGEAALADALSRTEAGALTALGEKGPAYVDAYYSWQKVEALFDDLTARIGNLR